MSAITLQPENYNHLSALNFKFNLKRAPNVNFFVTQANIPGVSLGIANQPSPFKNVPRPGDKIEYGTFDLTFRIDEDMNNYLEIYNWMIALGFPDNFNQYAAIKAADQDIGGGQGLVSDATLTLLTSAKNSNIDIVFEDMFPTQLTDVVFNLESSDVEYILATASFAFKNFTLTRL